MSKKTNRKAAREAAERQKKQQQQGLIIGVVIALIAVVGVTAFLMNSGGTAAPTITSNSSGEVVEVVNANISPNNYQSQFTTPGEDHILVDVRTPGEFAGGHIEGAVNIDVQEIANRLDELPKDQPIVLYCRSGNRSSQAARILENAGFTVIYDLGGIIDWQRQGLPTVQ